MLEKNKEYVGVVERLGVNGEGIIINEGLVVFVPYALPTEKIKYKVLKVKKDCAYGKVSEIFNESKDRVRPLCSVFGKCGGCQLQHLKYSSQLNFKKELVQNNFKKIAGIDIEVQKIHKSISEYEYRNKLQIPVSLTPNGTKIGFYATNSHRVVETANCIINESWAQKIIAVFNSFIKKYNLSGYDEENGTGLIRHIVVRQVNGNLIITLVVNSNGFPYTKELISTLSERFNNYSLCLNYNTEDTNVILSEKFCLVYGNPYEEYEYKGIKAEIDAKSFMQVNTAVSEAIYRDVAKQIAENDVVIDAYSGAGLMTAIISKKAKKVYGIEIVKEAVMCADILKEKNKLFDKMENICGACEDVLPDLVHKVNANVIVLDPPRKGCDFKVLQAIKKTDIKKVIYVSCNPSTLARDVGILTGKLEYLGNQLKKSTEIKTEGAIYNVRSVEIYDMFSQTKHVETVCVLERT